MSARSFLRESPQPLHRPLPDGLLDWIAGNSVRLTI